jgi:predicted small secreted protein
MRTKRRIITLVAIVLTSLSLASCSGNVGIGLSVGVPIGNHGYMSVGGTHWR